MIVARLKGYPYLFSLLYAAIYMSLFVYNNYIPIYFHHIGFSQTTIGILLGLSVPLAMVFQPIWGIAGDQAKIKNTVLKFMVFCSAVTAALIPLSSDFYYLLLMMVVFSFFSTSIPAVSDAITLEYLEAREWRFGPIRLCGTLGGGIIMVAAGILLKDNIIQMFPFSVALLVITLAIVFKLPPVKGYRGEEECIAVWQLFKNRELIFLLVFQMLLQICNSFNGSFFPIYYKEMGADNMLLGWAIFICCIAEVPFLLFADRILKKAGIIFTLFGSAIITALRWLSLYFIKDVYFVLVANILHGGTFIVVTFCMATYINRKVPKELRTSGQTLVGLVGLGIARFIGSTLGGALSDLVGVREVYLYSFVLCFMALAMLGSVFITNNKEAYEF